MTFKSLPRIALNIDGKTYNVCSVICHPGKSLHYGHYTTMITKWNLRFRCNDLISRQERFLRVGKDVYLITVEETKYLFGNITTKILHPTPYKNDQVKKNLIIYRVFKYYELMIF